MLPELQVDAERRDEDRPAVTVVTRIIDMLHAWRDVNAAPHVQRVVALDDVFTAVVQSSVAKQEPIASSGKVGLVILRNRVAHQRQPRAIIAAMPQGAICT